MVAPKDRAHTRMKAQTLKEIRSKSRNATHTKTGPSRKTHTTKTAEVLCDARGSDELDWINSNITK